MRNVFFLFLLFSIVFSSCFDDLPPTLEDNIFEDETTVFLELLDYDYNPWTGRLEIYYDVSYDFTKNDAIQGVALYANGNLAELKSTITPPYTFVQRNLPLSGTHCFRLAFLSGDVALRPTEMICIEL